MPSLVILAASVFEISWRQIYASKNPRPNAATVISVGNNSRQRIVMKGHFASQGRMDSSNLKSI